MVVGNIKNGPKCNTEQETITILPEKRKTPYNALFSAKDLQRDTDNLLLTEIHTLQTQRDGGKGELLSVIVFNKRFFSN